MSWAITTTGPCPLIWLVQTLKHQLYELRFLLPLMLVLRGISTRSLIFQGLSEFNQWTSTFGNRSNICQEPDILSAEWKPPATNTSSRIMIWHLSLQPKILSCFNQPIAHSRVNIGMCTIKKLLASLCYIIFKKTFFFSLGYFVFLRSRKTCMSPQIYFRCLAQTPSDYTIPCARSYYNTTHSVRPLGWEKFAIP